MNMVKISNKNVRFSSTHSERAGSQDFKKSALFPVLEKPCVGIDIFNEPEKVPLQDLYWPREGCALHSMPTPGQA